MMMCRSNLVGFLVILGFPFILIQGLESSLSDSNTSRSLAIIARALEEIKTQMATDVLSQLEKHSKTLAFLQEKVMDFEKLNERLHNAMVRSEREIEIKPGSQCYTVQSILKELQAHDNRLKEHVLDQQKQLQQINDILSRPSIAHDCGDVRLMGETKSGVYSVLLDGQQQISVYCDFSTPGGGWLVFQRRKDGSVDFYRTYNEYAKGFGDNTGEFWIGNDILHQLTTRRKYKLRIDMEDFDGEKRYAEYSAFSVGPAADKYRLTVSGYSGNAGDSFSENNGFRFTTKDADNDIYNWANCATHKAWVGAWWYSGHCGESSLNGLYYRGGSGSGGTYWYKWRGQYYSLKVVEMKIAAVK